MKGCCFVHLWVHSWYNGLEEFCRFSDTYPVRVEDKSVSFSFVITNSNYFFNFYFSKIPSVIFFQPITQRDHLKARGHVLNICLLNSDVETR